MAEMGESGGGGHDKGKKRAKKSSTRVDMTPMVDLAFLLLTFFVMTSTFSKPKVMSLVYPAKQEEIDPDPPKVNNAVTFLLSEDKVYYYEGQFYSKTNAEGKPPTQLEETTFGPSGLRKLLADRNAYVLREVKVLDAENEKKIASAKGNKERIAIQDSIYKSKVIAIKVKPESLKVLVKTDDKATCKNFIDLIDELKIAQIGVIAPVDIMASEMELIKSKK